MVKHQDQPAPYLGTLNCCWSFAAASKTCVAVMAVNKYLESWLLMLRQTSQHPHAGALKSNLAVLVQQIKQQP
jgi:hypothetical protein